MLQTEGRTVKKGPGPKKAWWVCSREGRRARKASVGWGRGSRASPGTPWATATAQGLTSFWAAAERGLASPTGLLHPVWTTPWDPGEWWVCASSHKSSALGGKLPH